MNAQRDFFKDVVNHTTCTDTTLATGMTSGKIDNLFTEHHSVLAVLHAVFISDAVVDNVMLMY